MPSAQPGTRIGQYEVVALVGQGGMGDVYRARDTRLQRDVAIKVMREAVSIDREHAARFEREARALAALNHPNIAVIHGIEQLPGDASGEAPVEAIVMEFVEGETLAERLRRGRLNADDVLDIATQIASALEAAHERGIVHRDLKPANVKITPSGTVKVLDLGIAKIVDTHESPTVTLTQESVIVGTPGYLAPEQAQGLPVDKRADIWAFGVLLYEMVTGERPFRGAALAQTLEAVAASDAIWERVPKQFEPLLRACLQREPRKRLRDVGDARFLLGASPLADAQPTVARRWSPLTIASLLIAVGALALAAFNGMRRPVNAELQPVRLTTMLPSGVSVTRGPGYTSSVAVSPDGRTVIIAGADSGGQQRLYRRQLDRLDATPLAGSERGSSPFFSWDGQWIGFFADGRLKRIHAEGGAALDIAAAPGYPAGASWGRDERIVFAYGPEARLQSVSAQGGEVETLADVEWVQHPEVVDDGNTVLFEANDWVYALDRETRKHTRITRGAAPRYVAGHLIVSRATTLVAAPLDLSRYELAGAVVPFLEGVATEQSGSPSGRHYAVSQNGTLIYVPAADAYALVIVTPDGSERLVTEQQRSFENPRFSPDGRYVVVGTSRRGVEPVDLWMHDLTSNVATRFTFGGGRAPVWSADGKVVTYSQLGAQSGIYTKDVSGRADATQVLSLPSFHWLVGWTPDRRTLAYGLMEGQQSSIMVYRDGHSRRLVGPGNTWGGRLSRDGKWLAYYLLESGTFEVYVTPFPDGGPRWLVAEGTDPAWSPDDTEIYYRSGPRLMAARIDKTSAIKVLSRRVAVEPFLPPLYDDYDIHPDGRTIVLARPANRTLGREVTIVLNALTALRRLN